MKQAVLPLGHRVALALHHLVSPSGVHTECCFRSTIAHHFAVTCESTGYSGYIYISDAYKCRD